jgi:hypothetical protein
MNDDACQRFAEDPEGNAAHLRECAKCAAIYGGVQTHAVNVDALPLAPWEGATYRSWPLVIGVALAVLAIALALCAAAGISPFLAIAIETQTQVSRAAFVYQKLRPLGPFVFAALFIAVNSLLVLLLRRAPRGIDA